MVVGQNASTPQAVRQDRLQIRDDFSTILEARGSHNLKIGVDLNPRITYNALFDLFKGATFIDDAGRPHARLLLADLLHHQRRAAFALQGVGYR